MGVHVIAPERVLANKADSSQLDRLHLRRRGIPATIPIPKDQAAHRLTRESIGGRPPAFDTTLSQQRHAVECDINQLKHHRTIARRYDKLALRYQATLHLATINIWLRTPTKTTS